MIPLGNIHVMVMNLFAIALVGISRLASIWEESLADVCLAPKNIEHVVPYCAEISLTALAIYASANLDAIMLCITC